MYFTAQQLAGGPKYSHKTRTGNWNEDWSTNDTVLKDYLKHKQTGALLIDQNSSKLASSNQRAALSFHADGTLHSGDNVLLHNCFTNAILVSNPNEKTPSSDAYAVTASKSSGACARSVFTIEHANQSNDSQIRFGQEVRLCTNAALCDRQLYLNSFPLTPMTFSRYSRNQEVNVYHKKAYNTIWRIQPASGVRSEQQGQAVHANDQVILEHAATSNYLSNDHINYQNEFGTELEVSCIAQSTKHKTQILLNEVKGTQVRENVHKQVEQSNTWVFVQAQNEEEAAPVQAQSQFNAQDLLNLIRNHLSEQPSLNFACMIHQLSQDHDLISVDQLVRALHHLDVTLNESDYQKLFAHYQANWNQPRIDWRNLAENLRCDLTAARKESIHAAYCKLDPQSLSKVTLDDIARNYCVDGAREVQNGSRTQEQHYNTFMGLWGALSPEQQISYEMFTAFFDNISAAYATDDEFCAMMKKCWSL